MSAKSITALSFILCSGLADACDTFTISGRVADQDSGVDTWIGVFEEPLADQAVPVESMWIDAGEFELEVPCAESVTLLAMRKGAVPLAKRISGSAPTTVDLRFAPGLSLTGSVHSDEDLPISGARVSLTRIDDVEVRLPESLTTWRSSNGGAVVVDGLAPGTYRVAASADGHMATLAQVVVGRDAANRIDIRLPRAYFLSGRVVDTSGSTVAGAEIDAAGATAASDSDGAFRIGPFRKGQRVTLTARANLSRSDTTDFLAPMDDLVVTLHHSVEIRGSVSNAFTGESVNDFALEAFGVYHLGDEVRSFAFRDAAGRFSALIAGNTREIEINAPGFAPWSTRVDFGSGGGVHRIGNVALEPERIVTGRVLDAASGLPVQAWVRPWIDPVSSDRLAPVTWTDEDGHYRLSGLPGGDVRLETGSPGYAQEVVGVPAGTNQVDIEMAAVTATIEGILVTHGGTPANGEVLLSKVGGTAESRPVENGKFAFEIAAKANDQYRLSARSIMGRVDDRHLTIRHDNESVTGVRLVVRRLGRVSGLLAGLDTAEGFSLVIEDGSGRVVQRAPWSPQAGRYSLQGIPEGRFTLRARTTSGRAIAREFESDGRGETVVDLVFAGASRLGGVVSAGGQPVPRIDIEATPLDRSLTSGESRTMWNGTYAINGLDDGEYVVRVRGRSFSVELSGDTYLDVELGPLAISGTVSAEGPVLGALVTATSAEGGPGGEDTVDSRGSFRIDGLDEGEYTVRVSRPGHREVSRTVYLGAAIEDFDVLLTVTPTDGREAEPSEGREGH